MCFNTCRINSVPRETHAQSHNSHAAFTLIELLVVLIIGVILVAMTIPMPGHSSTEKARRIKCVNNLKNVGLAFRIYSADNKGRFPWEIPDRTGGLRINYSPDPMTYILSITNELTTPKILQCRADSRDTRTDWTNWNQFSRTNLSYFISPDASQTLPQSFLVGDRNITNEFGALRPGLRSLSRTNNAAGWDQTIHKNQGNACMADGSVQQLSGARLRAQLQNTGQTNKSIKLSVP
jgi:prepilin-type N-terminal cleavage/methylation domain-containing protein/prepilin-type processing-associated H-X9-DG protein